MDGALSLELEVLGSYPGTTTQPATRRWKKGQALGANFFILK